MNSKERGQALVEFILVLPLLFFLMTSIVLLFSASERSGLDLSAVQAVSLSGATFPASEIKTNRWHSTPTLESLLYGAINASRISLTNSAREISWSASESACDPSLSLKGKHVTTCADGTGYLPSFDGEIFTSRYKIHIPEHGLRSAFEMSSALTPSDIFDSERRNKALAIAYGISTPRFEADIAAHGESSRERPSNFNRDCLMGYAAHARCNGQPGPLFVVTEQAALYSSKIQTLACLVEGGSKGPLAALGALLFDELGTQENPFCNEVKEFMEGLHNAVIKYGKALASEAELEEATIETQLLLGGSMALLY